jgi:DNA-binding MarR family transcriptional regulator
MAAEDALALCEIDSREFAVLDVLARADGPRAQATIANELRRDRTSAMRIARSLAGKGLVSLETDPRDRRAHTVAITRAGLQCLGLADDNLLAAAEDLLSILTESERTWVLTHVARLL